MTDYFIYILSNKGRTVLYTGVTNSLVRRVTQHRNGQIDCFTKKYRVNRLMYYEHFGNITSAIRREKQLKHWSRKKKEDLIKRLNPKWCDLAVTVLGLEQLG